MIARHFAFVTATVLLSIAGMARAVPVIVHQYDMEPTVAVTQAGWTHVDATAASNYVGTTQAGWDPTRTTHYVPIDEASSLSPYPDMQRDYNYSLGGMSVVFRELVPAGHGQMKFTLYRRTIDGYAPNYTMDLQLSDDSLTSFTTVFSHNGLGDGFGAGNTPLTGTIWFAPSASVRYMDFIFSSAGTKRINGLETVFPEPGSIGAIALVGVLALRRRPARISNA